MEKQITVRFNDKGRKDEVFCYSDYIVKGNDIVIFTYDFVLRRIVQLSVYSEHEVLTLLIDLRNVGELH